MNKARFKLLPVQQNVTGVQLLDFKPVEDNIDGSASSGNLGLARGGEQIEKCSNFSQTFFLTLRGVDKNFQCVFGFIEFFAKKVHKFFLVHENRSFQPPHGNHFGFFLNK